MLSERKISHSASLRATGSLMLASVASELPLRGLCATLRSRALLRQCRLPMSISSVRPQKDRPRVALAARSRRAFQKARRATTLACAYEDMPVPLAAGCGAGTGASLPAFSGGRGRGKGTVPEYALAHSPQEAANAKRMLKRLRPVAIIKPRAIGPRRPEFRAGPQAFGLLGQNH